MEYGFIAKGLFEAKMDFKKNGETEFTFMRRDYFIRKWGKECPACGKPKVLWGFYEDQDVITGYVVENISVAISELGAAIEQRMASSK